MASGLKGLDKAMAIPRKVQVKPSGLNATLNPDLHKNDFFRIKRLKSQRPNFIYDKLSHYQSSPYILLETELAKFLPKSVNRTLPKHPEASSWHLPAGYHLVFFPPPTSCLFKDGTDDMHTPGTPWMRRMWAGGSIDFMVDNRRRHLNSRLLQTKSVRCREEIVDAVVKGSSPEKQKFWIDIKRTIGPSGGLSSADRKRPMREGEMLDQAAIIERRNLVFMPAKTAQEAIDDISAPIRTIKPTIKPDFSVSMVPNANLLFRFSALTFNAHRIHLDREYARTVEGFRNLVVHGPLSLLLILKVLSSQMGTSKAGIPHVIKNIHYKNLAPLFADEKMTICVKRSQPQPGIASTEANGTETSVKADNARAKAGREPTEEEEVTKWDVWIENQEGGYAVKGTAETVAPVTVLPLSTAEAAETVVPRGDSLASPSGLPTRTIRFVESKKPATNKETLDEISRIIARGKGPQE